MKSGRVHTTWETDQRRYRQEQEIRRGKRIHTRIALIMALKQEGFRVLQVALNHFRVNGRLDLFPLHNEWHDTKRDTRGSAGDLVVFVREWMKS